jgi:multidrug resistance protein
MTTAGIGMLVNPEARSRDVENLREAPDEESNPKMDSSPVQSSSEETRIPYTSFDGTNKHLLTLLIGLATITSPLTATMYFPLLPLLREQFQASAQAINLTITIYIVFQALSPALFGPFSDSAGRRPTYLITLLIYSAGNLGLALNKDNYAVLIVLRALQSLGASAAFAVSYGVVADVCVPSERGKMLGPVSMALNLGACIGPIVGGTIAYTSGSYEWVFWILVIVGALLWLSIATFLPETARSLVGNGSRDRREWWQESWWSLTRRWLREDSRSKMANATRAEKTKDVHVFSGWRIPNPVSCLRLIFHWDSALALWMHGSFYTVDYSLVPVVPEIFKTNYGFNDLEVGLAYLPRGVGIIVGGYCNGRLMDRNYKITARDAGWTVDKVVGDDLHHFPIELARSRGSYVLLLVSTATLVAYGWCVDRSVHMSVPLILQFIQGFWGTCFYTTYNTLLIDIFPESPSTAAAAASVVRCAMAAAGVALLQPLLDAAGRGWYFTVLGLWSGSCGAVAVWMLRRWGMRWRQRRESSNEA